MSGMRWIILTHNINDTMARNIVLNLLFAQAASNGEITEWVSDNLPSNVDKGDTVWFLDFIDHKIVGGASVFKIIRKSVGGMHKIIVYNQFSTHPIYWEDAGDGAEVPPEMLTRLQYSRIDAYNGQDRTIPRVLDVCCGSRMMWYDRDDARALFMDIRSESHVLCDGRELTIAPDVVADFRDMPFPSGVFALVAFDPPHLLHVGENSWLRAKYGALSVGWQDDIRAGFRECWRVLCPGGTLVFKWCEEQVSLAQVLPLSPAPPMFGQRRGKTFFMVFYKSQNK